MAKVLKYLVLILILDSIFQGPRSNFEIGGHISDSILGGGGGTVYFFIPTPYNFKNIGGGTRPTPPLLRGPCFLKVLVVQLYS